jgi:uncharacterized protein (DUF433 family)
VSLTNLLTSHTTQYTMCLRPDALCLEEKMSRYSLNLPPALKNEAEQWANDQGVSLNQFILWSVAEKVGELRRSLDDPSFPGISYRRGVAGQPTPVVRGTGIRVQAIVIAARDWGLSPAQIAREYELSEAQVKECLTFYEAHRAELDVSLAAEEELIAQRG